MQLPSWTRGRVLLRDLLQIVNKSKDRGVIHGDIKFANVAFSIEGRAFILDWDNAQSRSWNKNLMLPGTLLFASPEQLRKEDVSFQTDIYSIGMLVAAYVYGPSIFHLYERSSDGFSRSYITIHT